MSYFEPTSHIIFVEIHTSFVKHYPTNTVAAVRTFDHHIIFDDLAQT